MTGRILALDPGTTHTGFALVGYDARTGIDGAVLEAGRYPNDELLEMLLRDEIGVDETLEPDDLVLVETMSPRGMRLGVETMEALRWSGILEQAARPNRVVRISRDEIKLVLLGKANTGGADAAIRLLLVDRFAAIAGDPTGGRAAAIGTKAHPGPLYGVKADAWAALAVICAHQDGARSVERERADRAAAKAAKAAA